MHGIDLILFDLDGTLIDSKEEIINGINFALHSLGLEEKKGEEIAAYIGRGIKHLISKSLQGAPADFYRKVEPIYEDYRRHSKDSPPLYSGVKEILEFFKSKKKVIITNGEYEFALLALKSQGIAGYFEDILTGDDLSRMKPSSFLVNKAMKRFNVKKEKTLIVGDMDLDILAGKSAGILTCAVTYGIGRRDDIIRTNPHYMIDDLLKLKEIIN